VRSGATAQPHRHVTGRSGGQRYPPNDHRVVKPWRLCRLVPNLAAPSRTVPDQAGCQDPLTPAKQGRSGVGGSSRTDPYEAHPAERSMLPCALGAFALPMRRSILGVMQFLLVRSGTGRDRPDSVPYRPCPRRALAVIAREVVDTADRWPAAEGGVGAVMVVPMDPGLQGPVAGGV
jgi:hypothetical protein